MNIRVGQARTVYSPQIAKSASFTTGCSISYRRTALRRLAVSFSATNLAEWTPTTASSFSYFCSSFRNCGNTCMQLIQQYVQKSRMTSLPRRSGYLQGTVHVEPVQPRGEVRGVDLAWVLTGSHVGPPSWKCAAWKEGQGRSLRRPAGNHSLSPLHCCGVATAGDWLKPPSHDDSALWVCCVARSGGGDLDLEAAAHRPERPLHLAYVGAVVRVGKLAHGGLAGNRRTPLDKPNISPHDGKKTYDECHPFTSQPMRPLVRETSAFRTPAMPGGTEWNKTEQFHGRSRSRPEQNGPDQLRMRCPITALNRLAFVRYRLLSVRACPSRVPWRLACSQLQSSRSMTGRVGDR